MAALTFQPGVIVERPAAGVGLRQAHLAQHVLNQFSDRAVRRCVGDNEDFLAGHVADRQRQAGGAVSGLPMVRTPLLRSVGGSDANGHVTSSHRVVEKAVDFLLARPAGNGQGLECVLEFAGSGFAGKLGPRIRRRNDLPPPPRKDAPAHRPARAQQQRRQSQAWNRARANRPAGIQLPRADRRRFRPAAPDRAHRAWRVPPWRLRPHAPGTASLSRAAARADCLRIAQCLRPTSSCLRLEILLPKGSRPRATDTPDRNPRTVSAMRADMFASSSMGISARSLSRHGRGTSANFALPASARIPAQPLRSLIQCGTPPVRAHRRAERDRRPRPRPTHAHRLLEPTANCARRLVRHREPTVAATRQASADFLSVEADS